MLKSLLFVRAALCCITIGTTVAFTQAPAIEWQKSYGGSDADFMNVALVTADGGYFFAGDSYSSLTGNKSEGSMGATDYWVMKTDASGNIEWQNTIGGSAYDVLYDAHQTPDGGYIIGGYSSSGISGDKTESNLGEQDYWVIKLTNTGAIEWQNALRTNKNDMCTSLHPTSDGGYIVGGFSSANINGDKTAVSKGLDDFWILKLDASGNISWQKTIGGGSTDMLVTIRQTTDGGYIAGGSSISNASGDKTENGHGGYDYWIVKLNSTGNIEWQNTIGGSDNDALSDLIQTSDGGYLLGGYSSSGISGNKTEANMGSDDYWVVKITALGNISWQNTLGGTDRDVLTGIHQTSDEGYIINGYTPTGISGDKTEPSFGGLFYGDYWILKLNAGGNLIWQKTIGGNGEDLSSGLDITDDGKIIIAGTSMSPVSGIKTEPFYGVADFWAIQLESGCQPSTEICNTLDDDCDGLIDDGITETISIAVAGVPVFCQGGSVVFTATYSGTGVQWKKNGVIIPGATLPNLIVTTKGSYSCITTSACDTTESTAVYVNVYKNPNASISAAGPTSFCAGGNVTLNVTPVGGCTYQWYKGASLIAGATTTSYIASTTGNYKCKVTKTVTGCVKFSNVIPVSIVCKESAFDSNNSVVYPNPAQNQVHVTTTLERDIRINLYDMLGNLLDVQTYPTSEFTISLENIPAGVYLLTISNNDKMEIHQLIKN